MPEISRKSRAAFDKAMQVEAELKSLNEELRPLHERMLRLQDQARADERELRRGRPRSGRGVPGLPSGRSKPR